MNSSYTVIPKSTSIELQSLKNGIELESPNHNGTVKERFEEDNVNELDVLPLIVDGDRQRASSDSGSGIPGSVFNLATSIIGAGIMALPATMKALGLVLGSFAIVVMGVLSEISIELLVRFSHLSKSASYGEVVQSALGFRMRILSEISIIINNAGILVVYLIIIGDVMSGSPDHVGVFQQLLGHGVWDLRKLVILVVLVVFLAPLCALEKIDSLSFTSAASVALAIVFVVVSCAVAFTKVVEGRIAKPRMGPDLGSKVAILDLLVVVPIMTNAYVCHFNVQPIYNELKGKSPQKMYRVGRITTLLCVLVYFATAVSGYLLFGDDTESDVLTNFDKDLGIGFSTSLNYVVRIGYVLHLVLVFPVIHFSLRQTVSALLFKEPLPQSRVKTLALTASLLGLIYLGSAMIPNIWVAFKFTGATTGLSLGFIFPCLIALKLDKQGVGWNRGERLLLWMMLSWALLVSIVGVVGNVYGLQSDSS
ncbi:probable sodium-coupled neutral amino acid transporter 6 [Phalaenopsis equestris]|uniref:probable sodium-coupled neutral amino acid transporter 6 n=1 Tax=Phalaenopsis equestris TaxID=78828 RepID=UPI0009E1A931|nr:probable sodium-coupled neutral amino acid transporter 6 [Phalaenopsis equestris]XP_020583579.1 probable sodium-coupled neutral amino acid transporter 6 [Phalaenopsis equestris]